MDNLERRRDLITLFLLSLAVRLAVAALISRPGYMDTAYYAAGAVQMAQGGGLDAPFLWTYLDDPAGLPHPGFLYWMVLPSLLAAPFAALFPGSFFALQLPFAFLSSLLPPLAYVMAREIGLRRRAAGIAALLTLFSGFFFAYWTLPETFAPFALMGCLLLWLAGRPAAARRSLDAGRWLLIGLLGGLAHLTRADAPLLLFVALMGAVLTHRRDQAGPRPWGVVILRGSLLALGYLVVMLPWFLRNMNAIGAPLSPAGTKTLWLTTYDDLYCYECDLSAVAYLAWGWEGIVRSKLWALGVNLQRFLAEDCLIFMLPFVVTGLYRLRRTLAPASVYLVLAFLAHSLAFTFPGPRGGFFHASSPALPFLYVAGAEGLETAVRWLGRRRRWNLRQAQRVFAAAVVVAAATMSVFVAAGKLSDWPHADAVYLEIDRWLSDRDVPPGTVVMVGNPPAFWYHTLRPSIVVPNEPPSILLEVSVRYDAAYIVLDANRPQPLAEMYASASAPGLELVATFDDGRVQLFRRTGIP